MTSSLYIKSYLAEDDNFFGCFAKDKLPIFPKSLIIDIDDSSKPGDHWVALVLFKTKGFYFDSISLPIVDLSILRFLKPYKKVTYSSTCIPDVASSNQCRQFCIAFIKNVRSKISYHKFVSMFNEVNLKYNDYIVNISLK